MDTITYERNDREKARSIFSKCANLSIPDAYDFPGSYISFLYDQHIAGGDNANTFYKAVVAAFQLGFRSGQRAAQKGKWVESPRRNRGKPSEKAAQPKEMDA